LKYAWLVIGIVAARFLTTAIAYPQLDGDLAWQRRLGETILRTHAIPRALGDETFTAAGAPWLPQEWAFSVLGALAGNGPGFAVFAGGVALAAILALVLTARQAEQLGASPRATVLCTAFAGIALFASFGVRAQVLAWPLLALFVVLLDVESPLAYAALGVAALWSNLHASALLAPALAAAATAGSAFDEGVRGPNVRRRATIALGSLAAICCNPFGWGLPLYALRVFAAPFKSAISEWKPTDLGDSSFAFGALPLLLIALVYVAGPSARRARDTIVLVVVAYLVLAATRNVAIFGIVAAPLAAAALSRNVAFFARTPGDARTGRATRYGLPAVMAVMAAVLTIALLRGTARTSDNVAARAIAFVTAGPARHRLFCADFAWCGLAVGSATTRVFIDGRADPYPAAVWNDYLAVARLRPEWRAVLTRYRVDAIVVAKDSAFDRVLERTPPWRLGFDDATYRVWLRPAGIARTHGRPIRPRTVS
jgi:hypothetical protein